MGRYMEWRLLFTLYLLLLLLFKVCLLLLFTDEYQVPEMQRTPLEDLVLQAKVSEFRTDQDNLSTQPSRIITFVTLTL